MLTLLVHIQAAWLTRGHAHVDAAAIDASTDSRSASERGQATAEYALVLLGVAAVALLVVSWASHTDKVGHLLDTVLEKITKGI